MQNNVLGLGLLTFFVEYAVYATLLWRLGHGTWVHIVLFVALMNGLTWPAATNIYHMYSIPIAYVELAVICIEGIVTRLWWRISWSNAFLLSTLANVASYAVGILCYS